MDGGGRCNESKRNDTHNLGDVGVEDGGWMWYVNKKKISVINGSG